MKEESPIRILLIDDDEDDFVLTRDVLEDTEQFDYVLDWEVNYHLALTRIHEENHDIYLIDYRLGEDNGLSLIQDAIERGISAPMILLTGKGDLAVDLKAMKYGAADYLVKGEITPHLIERTIRYAINNHRSLQMVKQSEYKFRKLFEQSIDAIYTCNVKRRFTDVNPAFERLMGYSHDKICNEEFEILFDKAEVCEQFLKKLHRDGTVKDFEAVLITENLRKIPCQLTSIVLTDNNGRQIGYQGIINDMTLRKKAEKELLLAERLSLTGKIARSVAHEVRNPLTNLGLAIDELEYLLKSDDEDIIDFIDIVKSNAKRIGELITEMLNSSKPKELDKTSVNIDQFLDETIALVNDRFKLKNMKLVKSYRHEDKPLVLDPSKMSIALVNILINAVEAMEEGEGLLEIATSHLNNYFVMEIRDNGCGIAEEDLNTLFDPFYTKKQGGMGLGLTSTQNIIRSHNGSLEVESKENEGTIFIISLPLE